MAKLADIKQYEQKKAQNKADALPANIPQLNEAVTPQSQSVREGFQQMGEMNPQKPVLQTKSPAELNQMYENTRKQALGHESNYNDPQKAMEYWNASPYEFWTEQVKRDPNNTYAIVNQMFASNETPEQKRKRERREALGETFRGLGNLIGNAANLYYTHRGGQYIDLNSVNEKHRERMDRIKEKQDALAERQKEILMNARLGDIQAARAEAAKKEEREYNTKVAADKAKADQKLAELKYLQEMGVLTAKQAGELAKIETQAEYDAKIAGIKNDLAIRLKGAPSYSDSKIVESMTDKDGNTYTRSSKLTDSEKAQIASMLPMEALEAFTSKTYDKDGNETGQRVDYEGAAAWAINQGYITPEVAEQIGFKKGKSSKKKGNSLLPGSKSTSLLPK